MIFSSSILLDSIAIIGFQKIPESSQVTQSHPKSGICIMKSRMVCKSSIMGLSGKGAVFRKWKPFSLINYDDRPQNAKKKNSGRGFGYME